MRLFSALFIVVLVYQIDHNLHHDIFFFRSTFGNHQSKGNESAVGNTLGAVGMVEDVIFVEEPKEQRGSNALVAVNERVVLRYEIEQHGSFLLYAGI